MVIVVLRPSREGKSRSALVIPHESDMDVGLVETSSDAGPSVLEETGVGGLYVLGDGGVGDAQEGASNGTLNCKPYSRWTEGHREILARSLELDMPVLAVGDGLFLLNEVFGGQAPESAASIWTQTESGVAEPNRRTIYVSPGSKTAAILGAGGFFRLVGGRVTPSLMDSHRAPRLLASAYEVEEGTVEGLESAEHSWILGFRANLSGEEKLPRGFGGIFQAFVERAQGFLLARTAP